MKLIDIGALSKSSGVPPSTLRYYEQIGLIRSVARHGLRRQYEAGVVTRLALISMGKMAGFSLDDIRNLLLADGNCQLPRTELHRRADSIDEQIRGLTRLGNALRHVADCPAETHMACPKFRRLLQFASHKAGTGRRSQQG